MNQPQIKIVEFNNERESFDFKINNLIKSINPINHKFILNLKHLIDYMLDFINKDIFYNLFEDLNFELIDNRLKEELKRRVNIINKELMPLFHPLFQKEDFIKYRIVGSSLNIDTLNNSYLQILFNKYQKGE